MSDGRTDGQPIGLFVPRLAELMRYENQCHSQVSKKTISNLKLSLYKCSVYSNIDTDYKMFNGDIPCILTDWCDAPRPAVRKTMCELSVSASVSGFLCTQLHLDHAMSRVSRLDCCSVWPRTGYGSYEAVRGTSRLYSSCYVTNSTSFICSLTSLILTLHSRSGALVRY